jgi:neuronal growth regulator 1
MQLANISPSHTVLGIEPTFDVPIVNVTVVAGQTAMLPCSIEDLGRYKVRFA